MADLPLWAVDGKPGQLVRIRADLGIEHIEATGTSRNTWRVFPLRRYAPDFCALFAADGQLQIEAYLANWAAYCDYVAQHDADGDA